MNNALFCNIYLYTVCKQKILCLPYEYEKTMRVRIMSICVNPLNIYARCEYIGLIYILM